jgi:hypothetical protein
MTHSEMPEDFETVYVEKNSRLPINEEVMRSENLFAQNEKKRIVDFI